MKILSTIEYNGFETLPKAYHGYDFRTIEEYYDLNGINPNSIESEMLEYAESVYFVKNWQWGGILERPMIGHIIHIEETLKTHSASMLVEKIRNEFADCVTDCRIDNKSKTTNDIVRIELDNGNDIANKSSIGKRFLLKSANSDRLYDLLEFFNYYITLINEENNSVAVYLEPVYTRCVTDEFKSNGKYAYHITDVENISKILSGGLRPKTTKIDRYGNIEGYRYFPQRIFYVGACNTREETIDNIRNLAKTLGKRNYAVVEINIEKHYIDFWEDRSATDIEHTAYSYTAIPKTLIENIVTDVEQIDF